MRSASIYMCNVCGNWDVCFYSQAARQKLSITMLSSMAARHDFIYDGRQMYMRTQVYAGKLGFCWRNLTKNFLSFCVKRSCAIEFFSQKTRDGQMMCQTISRNGCYEWESLTCEFSVKVLDKMPSYSVLITMRDVSEQRGCEMKCVRTWAPGTT
jgi:hypothetical protein